MDTPNPPRKPAHLLDDLEDIRKLLRDDTFEPPVLTDPLDHGQIPLLSDIIEPGPAISAQVASTLMAKAAAPATPHTAATSPASGELLRVNGELRAAAQLILQDVIDDFVPQIEAELKRRLDARLDRLLSQRKP
jgi:hypothetical protein